MALILPALYKKTYESKQFSDIDFNSVIDKIRQALSNSFLERNDYTASSTNSREIAKLVDEFTIDD